MVCDQNKTSIGLEGYIHALCYNYEVGMSNCIYRQTGRAAGLGGLLVCLLAHCMVYTVPAVIHWVAIMRRLCYESTVVIRC